jgi:hypothetical protein
MPLFVAHTGATTDTAIALEALDTSSSNGLADTAPWDNFPSILPGTHSVFGSEPYSTGACSWSTNWGDFNLPDVAGYRLPLESIPEMRTSMKDLDGLTNLQHGWDQAGAEPISRYSIEVAKVFIAQLPSHLAISPKVVPMSLGRLQLEWHSGPRSLELEFESPSLMHFLKWDSSQGIEDEDVIPVTSDWRPANDLLAWFVQGSADASDR